jgi:hypothetical protein
MLSATLDANNRRPLYTRDVARGKRSPLRAMQYTHVGELSSDNRLSHDARCVLDFGQFRHST